MVQLPIEARDLCLSAILELLSQIVEEGKEWFLYAINGDATNHPDLLCGLLGMTHEDSMLVL